MKNGSPDMASALKVKNGLNSAIIPMVLDVPNFPVSLD
jgi:hypothetical protein